MNIPVHHIDGQPLKHKLSLGDFIVMIVLVLVGCILGLYLGLVVLQRWVAFQAPEAIYQAQNAPSDVKPLAQ